MKELWHEILEIFDFIFGNKNDAAIAYTLPNVSPPNVVAEHPLPVPADFLDPSRLPLPKPVAPTPLKHDWSTPLPARHSIRLICDEEGLTVEQKNTMCATIGGESGWSINAINHNSIGGRIVSTDFGICQWNDIYHGKEISPTEAMNNPEKAVRLMCSYWKRGQRNLWIAYKSGRYKDFYDPPSL